MTGDHGLDQGDVTDPAAAIRRHARGIMAALTAIDLANPDAEPVTRQCRAIIDTLLISLAELSYFTGRTGR